MILLNWVGGEHEFALKIGELRKLQDSCEAGPEQVLNRMAAGEARVNDMIEPIRLGLIGSGAMKAAEAGPFVTALLEQHPLMQFKMTALSIMADALYGPEDDMPGEPQGDVPPPENGALVN